MPPRCFLGCPSDLAGHLHVFPNPKRLPEKFEKWVYHVGGQLKCPEDYEFYRSKRLCDRHFTEKDRNRYNRLNALAVPSLFLKGPLMEIDANIPLLQATSLSDPLTESESAPLSPSEGPITSTSTDMGSLALNPTENIMPSKSSAVDSSPFETLFIHSKITESSTSESAPLSQSEGPIESTSTDMGLLAFNPTENLMPNKSSAVDNSLFETSFVHSKNTDPVLPYHKEHNYCIVEHPTQSNVAASDSPNRISEQRQIRGLKQQVNMLRKRCSSLKKRLATASKMSVETAFQKITKNMTAPAKLFTRMQFSQTHKKPSGRRFSLEEKVLALSFYIRSPKCYSLLAHCFTMPSKKSLKGLLDEVKHGC